MTVPNANPENAKERFDKLNGLRNGLLLRAEQYARWTIPKLFPRENRVQDTEPLNNDYQSLGAQCVNNLANRLMLSLFAPSRPFFRLALSGNARKEAAKVPPDKLREFQAQFAVAETEASLELDKRSIRSKLYDLLKHLIVVGNALLVFEKDAIRVLSLRNYVVKRNVLGEVVELVVKEKVHKDHLKPGVLTLVQSKPEFQPDNDGYVCQYHWIKLTNDKYQSTQWIDTIKLPAQFESSYSKDKLKYRAVTWDLAAGDDYGTGLVEDYSSDFAALSMLSRATVHAAILASEFRWLVNPTGMTSVDDFMLSANGAALPGQKGDIELIQSGVNGTLETNVNIQSVYVNRIGAGFMLQSAVTRHSERTTAYEIQKNGEELEGGLGGAYSRIAVDVQVPVAYWTMTLIDKDITTADVEPVIVTGLAALSRMGDRDRLLVFGQNLTAMLTLPPQVLDRLKLTAWISDLASAEGLDPTAYVLSEAEFNQMRQAQAQQQLAMQNAQQQVAGMAPTQETQ